MTKSHFKVYVAHMFIIQSPYQSVSQSDTELNELSRSTFIMAHSYVNQCSEEFIMQTKCELNIPDLVKLGHGEIAA